jgi:hypothetical protein
MLCHKIRVGGFFETPNFSKKNLKIILHTPSKFVICMRRPLKFTNFNFLCLKFCFWTPNYSTKVPSFSHYESEFVWEVPLELNIFRFWVRRNLLNTKLLNKSAIIFVLWWIFFNQTEQNSDFALILKSTFLLTRHHWTIDLKMTENWQ